MTTECWCSQSQSSTGDFHTYIVNEPNDFSTIRDIPFRLKNSMLALTGKLCLQTRIAIDFLYDILCCFKLFYSIDCYSVEL